MLKKDEKMLDGECHPAFFFGADFCSLYSNKM